MKALEKENSDRYENAAAMRDDLLAFARGAAVEGRPLNTVERVRRMARRNAKPLLAVAAVAAALLIGIALLPPAPAQLEIACVPPAQVHVADAVRGTTPLSVEVPPGEHLVELRCAGFSRVA